MLITDICGWLFCSSGHLRLFMDMPEMTTSSDRHRHRNVSEPSSSVIIERPQHAGSLLAQLNAMRSDSNSVDAILIADGTEFPCHRAVLSASSQYFRMMFGGRLRESQERRIKFDGVTALALGRLVDFVYSGQIKVHCLLKYLRIGILSFSIFNWIRTTLQEN